MRDQHGHGLQFPEQLCELHFAWDLFGLCRGLALYRVCMAFVGLVHDLLRLYIGFSGV